MSVQNFIPALWSAKILKELDKEHMLVKNCSTEYSGEITGLGSSVKINSINTPTIGDYIPNVTVITPEELKDESRVLTIEKAKYFSIKLDKVDKTQGTKGILEEAIRKATLGLKDAADQYIAGLYTQAGATVTQATLTSGNIFSTLEKAKTILFENNVAKDGEIILEVSPDVWQKMVLADIVYNNQNNGDTIRKGQYSPVLGMMVYMSNNLVFSRTNENVANTKCLMRTKEAIGYAEQIMDTIKYMPENSFSEAVKGLHVYGAKTLKPKEFVCLDLTTAAETTI